MSILLPLQRSVRRQILQPVLGLGLRLGGARRRASATPETFVALSIAGVQASVSSAVTDTLAIMTAFDLVMWS